MDTLFGKQYLDSFLKLPRKAQELVFSYISAPDDCEGLLMPFFERNLMTYSDLSYSFCDSPIEQIFAVAYDLILSRINTYEREALLLNPQQNICIDGKNYFADFLVSDSCCFENGINLVIECDGHDFHEKTKEQVAYNNERDMSLKKHGYDVIHFSGSQIFNHPMKCANDAYTYARSLGGNLK